MTDKGQKAKEQKAAARKRYRAANPAKIKKAAKAYRIANAKELNAYGRDWREANSGKQREARKLRREVEGPIDPRPGFPVRLQQARIRSGFTNERLALQAGLSEHHIGCLEHGDRLPTILNLIRIQKALGVSWDKLLGVPSYQRDKPLERSRGGR